MNEQHFESDSISHCTGILIESEQELTTKNRIYNPYMANHDIFSKNTLDLCVTPLQSLHCSKGNDHHSFIDLKSFSLNHLPKCYQHNEMLNLVKALANLIVMVQVPIEENVYCQGTGKIEEVFFNTNKTVNCCCFKCSTSLSPSTEWGIIRIVTSANLLNNCKDPTKYMSSLFFDGEDKVVNVFGNYILSSNVIEDVSKYVCVTCDTALLQKLDKLLDEYITCWSDAVCKYYPSVKCEEEKLVVMISHPHGCKKHICVGQWSKLKPRVLYNNTTCPGSAGTYLLLPTFDKDDDEDDDDDI